MTAIDVTKKFAIHPETLDMTERRSARVNATGEVVNIGDLMDTVMAVFPAVLLSQDQLFAIGAANNPSGSNPFATQDDIAFKSYSYKALLTQTGVAAPISRVLNQSDGDFIPTPLAFEYSNVGKYAITDFFVSYDLTLTEVVISGFKVGTTADWQKTGDDLIINTYDATGTLADALLDNTCIEITVRLRGEAPVIMSAETNEAGDVIILQYNKRMNDYLFTGIEGDIVDTILNYTFTAAVGSNGTSIELTPDTDYVVGDSPLLTYAALVPLESFDLGLAPAFTDEPVTNNVPYLMSAETNVEGTKIICTFNRPMGNVATPTNVKVNKDGGGTAEFDTINLGATPFNTFEINMTETMTPGDVLNITIDGTGVPTEEGTAVTESTGVAVVNNVA